MTSKRREIEEMKKVENKVIEKVAEALILVAKEISQKEKEFNMPSGDFGSGFYFNPKVYGNKDNRN